MGPSFHMDIVAVLHACEDSQSGRLVPMVHTIDCIEGEACQ